MTEDSKTLLTPQELCERWRYSVQISTLTSWRYQKKGPKYIKIGSKVLYDLDDVLEYEEANMKEK